MRAFVSFAQEDLQSITPVCQTLDAWQLLYWAPVRDPANPEQNTAIEQGLGQADIFLRICTAHTPRSYWMTMEQTAFHSAQAEEYRQMGHLNRKVINLIMDKQYQRLPFDYADPIIDATDLQDMAWRKALYTAIFTPPV
jgi:hypothetical protein